MGHCLFVIVLLILFVFLIALFVFEVNLIGDVATVGQSRDLCRAGRYGAS